MEFSNFSSVCLAEAALTSGLVGHRVKQKVSSALAPLFFSFFLTSENRDASLVFLPRKETATASTRSSYKTPASLGG